VVVLHSLCIYTEHIISLQHRAALSWPAYQAYPHYRDKWWCQVGESVWTLL